MTETGFDGAGRNEAKDACCAACSAKPRVLEVIAIDGDDAEVIDAAGTRSRVAIDFLPQVEVGDRVVVRLGVALGLARAEAVG
jgi:hydrogenase maturation factor